MKTQELLNGILAMLQGVKDNHEKLQEIYNFLKTEIYGNMEDDEEAFTEIPDKYLLHLKEIVQEVEAGMTCFVNPDTIEIVPVPQEYFNGTFYGDSELFEEDLEKIDTEWERFIRIEPPESWESYQFMVDFIDSLNNKKLQNQLLKAIERKRPFANFKNIIDNSDERQTWFNFRYRCIEEYVRKELSNEG